MLVEECCEEACETRCERCGREPRGAHPVGYFGNAPVGFGYCSYFCLEEDSPGWSWRS